MRRLRASWRCWLQVRELLVWEKDGLQEHRSCWGEGLLSAHHGTVSRAGFVAPLLALMRRSQAEFRAAATHRPSGWASLIPKRVLLNQQPQSTSHNRLWHQKNKPAGAWSSKENKPPCALISRTIRRELEVTAGQSGNRNDTNNSLEIKGEKKQRKLCQGKHHW